MKYFGISTNNLKHIDFYLYPKEIVILKGVSGCGKSSLAIDTIYQISSDELSQLSNINVSKVPYSIDGYENIIPSICLRQENYNQNPRSTIGTYFNLLSYLQNIFSYISKQPHIKFQFNNIESACKVCNGLGSVPLPEPKNFIDSSIKISARAFSMWRNKDVEYHEKLLHEFLLDNNISPDERFDELSKKEKELILYGESSQKHTVKYKCNGRYRSKTGHYKGPMLLLNEILEEGKIASSQKKYFVDSICKECNGSRYSKDIDHYKLNKKTLSELVTMDFSSLEFFLKDTIKKIPDKFIFRQCSLLLPFISSANKIKLDYLSLSRSIPSLSGGELQRLCLAKASVTQFNNFLYVMDEPVSALHPKECEEIKNLLTQIRDRGNSLLIIEHSDTFDSISNRIVWLGPDAGKNGGNIVELGSIKQEPLISTKYYGAKSQIQISNEVYNNVVINSVSIPKGTMVGVCGVSGSGKTTFLKNILPRYIKNYNYFDQSSLRGNVYSIVATAINILGDIEKYYSEGTKKNIKNFWFSSESPGQCPYCKGIGLITENTIGWNSEYICPVCQGKRFTEKTLTYKINNLSIYDFLSLSVNEIIQIVPKTSIIYTKLQTIIKLGLGYIKLFQKTDSLSGGECQRIKLAAAILKTKKPTTLILDEPFRGLDLKNTNRVISFLYQLIEAGYSIYLAEHNPYVLSRCSYLIEFGPGAGKNGGKIIYSGTVSDIKEQQNSLISHYLSL